MNMRNLLLTLLFSVLALFPSFALAVPDSYEPIPNLPTPSAFGEAAFGNDVVISGTYVLPLDWVASIKVFLDGVQVSAKGGTPTLIAIKNLISEGATGQKTATFSYNIGPVISGVHALRLEFTGGELCAVNYQYNALNGTNYMPSCVPKVLTGDDNYIPIIRYTRDFTVSQPPSPNLVVTPSTNPAINFSNVGVNTSQTRDFTLQNTGTQALSGTMTGISAPFSCVTAGCNYSIAPGGTIPFTIRYTAPSTVQPSSITVSFSCTLACPMPTQSRTITANSVAVSSAPQISVDPTTVDYGNVISGRRVQRTVRLNNTGGTVLTGTATFSSPRFACPVSCAYTVQPGTPIDFPIDYIPTTGSGAQVDTVSFTGGTTQTATLKSNIVITPIVRVSPSPYDAGTFPAGNPPVNFSIDVSNVGAGTLSGGVTFPAGSPFSCASACSYSGLVYGGAPHRVTMTFNSQGTPVNVNAEFTNNTGGEFSSVFLPLTANNNAPPRYSVSAQRTNFGSITLGNTSQRTITITNLTGTAIPLRVMTWTPSAVPPRPRQHFCVINCDFVLAPWGTTPVTLEFRPIWAGDAYGAGSIVVGNWEPGGFDLSLDGFGSDPKLRVTVFDPIDRELRTGQRVQYGTTTFGPTTKNRSMPFLIENDGEGPMNYTITPSANFKLGITPRSPIPFWSDDSIHTYFFEVPIIFTPTAVGVYQENLRIDYDYGDGVPRVLNFTAYAESRVRPVLEVTPLTQAFGDVLVGAKPRKSFSLKNIGNAPLTGTASIETYANYLMRTEGQVTTATNGEEAFRCFSGCGTYTIAVGGAPHVVEYEFAPISARDHEAHPRFLSDGGNESGLITGRGISQAAIDLSPLIIDFGSVNQSSFVERDIRVTNTGLGNLIGNVTFSPAIHYSCVPATTGCTYNVLPGAANSRLITVRFRPLDVGPLNSVAVFNSNAINDPPIKAVSLTGVGVFGKVADIRTTGSNFGAVPVNKPKIQDVEIANFGTDNFLPGTILFNSPAYTCVGPIIDPVSGLCTYTLTANGTPNSKVTIQIRFLPTRAGPINSTFSLSGVSGSLFDLTGRGISPSVKFIEPAP